MDRISVISSAQPAMFGITSENSMPQFPYGLKLRGLGQIFAVGLMNARLRFLLIDSGRAWPSHLLNDGFGSNRSRWLGPPAMNRKMTFFALGAKCGALGLRG